MTNLSDKIISVFLDKQVLILKNSDISLSLIAQGIQCYAEDVRRHAQLLSPGLFQLSYNKDSTVTIRVDPQVIDFVFFCFFLIYLFRLIFVDHFLPVIVIIR